jgi:flavin-binding protein dodecin
MPEMETSWVLLAHILGRLRSWVALKEKFIMAQKVVHPESTYDVIELIGTSTVSWEDAAKNAIEEAAKTLRDLRVAEVVDKDLIVNDGKVQAYRTKVKLSFKYEGHHWVLLYALDVTFGFENMQMSEVKGGHQGHRCGQVHD